MEISIRLQRDLVLGEEAGSASHAAARRRPEVTAQAPEQWPAAELIRWGSFADYLGDLAQWGERTLFTWRDGGEFRHMSYAAMTAEIDRRARYLVALGLRPQDSKLALVSEAHRDWLVWAFAALRAGIILVPLDARATATELAAVLDHVEVSMVLHSAGCAALVDEVLELTTVLPTRLSFDRCQDIPDLRDIVLSTPKLTDVGLITYTSGTFGGAKAVMIPHRALLFQGSVLSALVTDEPGTVVLSHLPLHHVFEFCHTLACIARGCEVLLCEKIDKETLGFWLSNRKIQRLATVPLLLETLEGSIRSKVASQNVLVRALMTVFFAVASLPVGYWLRRRMFAKIHRSLGSGMRHIVSGGAPLKPRTYRFFSALGISIHQGYGLTETGPVISYQRMGDMLPGTVGPPIPGVEVKISAPNEDGVGEIRTRGPHVLLGYFKEPGLTRDAFDKDGYFRTGDLGLVGSDGHLRILGRRKRLIVLSNGKKVHAEEVEAVASQLECIAQACALSRQEVRGGSQDGVVLAVTLTPAFKERFADTDLSKRAEEQLRATLRALSPFKRPGEIFVMKQDLPTTITRKVIPPQVASLLRQQLTAA